MKAFALSLLPVAVWVAAVSMPAQAADAAATATAWGTYEKLYSARSPWNSRPVNPQLGTAVVPMAQFFPIVHEGSYSTGVFKAASTDGPITVYGLQNGKGILDADTESYRPSITLPHWPKDVVPASGSDGHADIVDEELGIIHSFLKLQKDGDTWRAAFYTWSKLDGRGWGDPAHYYQGARATGVPASGGLIRRHEVNDGDTMYRHALAMSMTYNALSPNPAYVFPATSADATAAKQNFGKIPQGTLMMLPPDFNVSALALPQLRKIAETLKVYGAYVVDRNVGTPYAIYVENGAGIGLGSISKTPKLATDLQLIRSQLRPMVSAEGWLDGNGAPFVPEKRLNLASLRGIWMKVGGDGTATYDSWKQAVVVEGSTRASNFVNYMNRSISKITWSAPVEGKKYVMTAHVQGAGSIKLNVMDTVTKKLAFATNALKDGEQQVFSWPTNNYSTWMQIQVPGGATSTVSLELMSAE